MDGANEREISGEAALPPAFRLGDLLQGAEPPPARFLERLHGYPWLIVGVTCVGAFIGQLDASIVQLALPTLGHAFDASVESVSWVALGYLLAFACFLPVFGQLCEILGRKLLYILGFLLFAGASLLCGFAADLPSLVGFRILQGVGGAMLGANSIAVLVAATDKSRRARALGVFSAAQAIGVSAGPAVGGLLLGALGWRAVFWVSAPFGLAAAIAGWFVLPRTPARQEELRFDADGALLLGPALILAVLWLNQISALGRASPVLIGCAGAGALLLILFVRRERTTASPLVDLRLFSRPGFLSGVIACALGYAMLYGMFFLAAFALTRGYDDSPALAGLKLTIVPAALGLVATFGGGLTDRLGPRFLCAAGMTLCAAALVGLSLIVTDAALLRSFGAPGLVVFGVGLGLFIAPNTHATIAAAPSNRSGEAGALLNLMRILGTSLGVASASSMLSWQAQLARGADANRVVLLVGPHVIEAVRSGLWMLAGFAVVAGVLSLLRRAAAV